MKVHLVKMVSSILQRISPPSDDIVYIEGGMGSQILSFMQHQILLETNPKAKLDARYFYTPAPKNTKVWDWELSEYGHPLPKLDVSLRAKLRYLGRESTTRASKSNLTIWEEISKRRFQSLFPLHESTADLKKLFDISENQSFAAIHIRRGDYLTVSSKLIAVEEYLEMIERMSSNFDLRVLVFSDDPFSDLDQARINSACRGQVSFITGLDQHGVHGLMRCAATLVTSNSTFSLTAALLSEHTNPTILAPTLFFSNQNRDVNLLIQQLSRWMFIERGTNGP
jgi:hypothetical protein